MVQMAMADQNVVNAGQFIQAHFTDATAGINQNIVVQQKSRGVTTRRDGPRATQDADHGAPPSLSLG